MVVLVNNSETPTFRQISEAAQSADGSPNRHLRFDGTKLYTSRKFSFASVKAALGFPKQLEVRLQKRGDAMAFLKQAIDREYHTPGLGAHVLALAESEKALDFSTGIKLSDIDLIECILKQQQHEALIRARDDALNDPRLKHLSTGQELGDHATTMKAFFADHFDILSSQQFWNDSRAKSNSDNFGALLAITLLERIQQSGRVTERDVQDLRRVLDPCTVPGVVPVELPATLQGPLDEPKLLQLTQLVFDRYVDADGAFPLNMGDGHKKLMADFPNSSGAKRLAKLSDLVIAVLNPMYLGSDNITGPLQAVK